jgi:hypothetical protein
MDTALDYAPLGTVGASVIAAAERLDVTEVATLKAPQLQRRPSAA